MVGPVIADTATLPVEGWDDPARGSIRWQTLFSGETTPTKSLVCGVAHLSPGDSFAFHHHPQDEVYFGVAGEGEVTIDGIAHRIAAGVAIFIPGGAVHGITPTPRGFSYFYAFAADRFDEIVYSFLELPAVPVSIATPAPDPDPLPEPL